MTLNELYDITQGKSMGIQNPDDITRLSIDEETNSLIRRDTYMFSMEEIMEAVDDAIKNKTADTTKIEDITWTMNEDAASYSLAIVGSISTSQSVAAEGAALGSAMQDGSDISQEDADAVVADESTEVDPETEVEEGADTDNSEEEVSEEDADAVEESGEAEHSDTDSVEADEVGVEETTNEEYSPEELQAEADEDSEVSELAEDQPSETGLDYEPDDSEGDVGETTDEVAPEDAIDQMTAELQTEAEVSVDPEMAIEVDGVSQDTLPTEDVDTAAVTPGQTI